MYHAHVTVLPISKRFYDLKKSTNFIVQARYSFFVVKYTQNIKSYIKMTLIKGFRNNKNKNKKSLKYECLHYCKNSYNSDKQKLIAISLGLLKLTLFDFD